MTRPEIRIAGIDPGANYSGLVVWNGNRVIEYLYNENKKIKEYIKNYNYHYAIEQIRGYGQVSGNDTYDTCFWSGVFYEAALNSGGSVELIPRKEIKHHLCGNTTTNDKYIRQSIIDRFGVQGTKKNPGPLYGISNHLWAALAVAVVARDKIAGGGN